MMMMMMMMVMNNRHRDREGVTISMNQHVGTPRCKCEGVATNSN